MQPLAPPAQVLEHAAGRAARAPRPRSAARRPPRRDAPRRLRERRVVATVDEVEEAVDEPAVRRRVDPRRARRGTGAHLAEQARAHLGRRREAAGARAQAEHARQDRLRALGRVAAGERAEVDRAVGTEPPRDGRGAERGRAPVRRRKATRGSCRPWRLYGGLSSRICRISSSDAASSEPVSVTRTSCTWRISSRARREWPRALLNQLAQALAQAPGLADVEQPAVLAEQVVHARRGGHRREALARHVHHEGLAVAGRVLQREQLVQPRRCRARPRARGTRSRISAAMRASPRPAMAVVAGDAERRGDGVERAAAQLGQQPARQAHRAERGPRERAAGERAVRGVEVADVEARRCARPARRRRRTRGSAAAPRAMRRRASATIASVMPVSADDEGRDRPARVDERREGVEQPAVDDAHRADLGDAAVRRAAAGGLEVDDDERLVRRAAGAARRGRGRASDRSSGSNAKRASVAEQRRRGSARRTRDRGPGR